jgi:hypothetical protein
MGLRVRVSGFSDSIDSNREPEQLRPFPFLPFPPLTKGGKGDFEIDFLRSSYGKSIRPMRVPQEWSPRMYWLQIQARFVRTEL